MNRDRVLAELTVHQGRYISGQELADRLNISRVAIWKHIEILKEQGYDISAVSGRGYQLTSPGGLINALAVQNLLTDVLIGSRISYLPRVDSTSDALKRLSAENALEEGSVLAAGTQERGKGRRGRHWESPSGGLWFSFYLKPMIPLENIGLLSLVFSVAIARGLDRYLPVPPTIKWPNDVYSDGKKITGILLETSGEMDAPDYLVTGVGINTNVRMTDFPAELRNSCTSLLELAGVLVDHNELLAEVLQSLDQYYRRFLQEGFTCILPEFKERCFHLGQRIELMLGKRKISGNNVDINERGHLLVESGEEIIEITAGDVNLLGR